MGPIVADEMAVLAGLTVTERTPLNGIGRGHPSIAPPPHAWRTPAENPAYVAFARHALVWERQAEIAERAFAANGFFVPADARQVEELDKVVDLTVDPDLVFIKLVALVGG
ncbi:hypothetical protein ACWC2T_21850 [Streptomyces sp. NPDC001393]